MAHVVSVVLAVMAGLAGYYEVGKFERRRYERPPSILSQTAAGGCFLAGLAVTVFVPAVVAGALVGFVGYNEAETYEKQCKERFQALPALAWGAVAGFLGFVAAAVTSPVACLVAGAFAGLAGALLLVVDEKHRLLAENRMWIAENRRLLVERNPGQQPPVSRPETPAAPEAKRRQPRPAAPTAPQWGTVPPRPAPQHPVAVQPSEPGRGDLLPRRSR